MLEIIPIWALKDNYIWVILNKDEHSAIAIDPGEAPPLIHYLTKHQLDLKAVLVTHHHWDHTNGILPLKNQYDALRVYGSSDKINGVTHVASHIVIDGFPQFEMLPIPGHTLDHVAYYGDGILFCGDTLFSAGCGRVFEGTMPQMFASLQKLAALPDTTKIYCGHEYTMQNLKFAKLVEPHNKQIDAYEESVQHLLKNNAASLPGTLKIEKEINPFLRCHIPDVVARAELEAGKKLDDAIQVFSCLRTWKNNL